MWKKEASIHWQVTRAKWCFVEEDKVDEKIEALCDRYVSQYMISGCTGC